MIQAILFKRNKWNLNEINYFLTIHNIKYLSYRITNTYFRVRLKEPDYNNYIYRIRKNNFIDYIEGIHK